MHTLLAEYIWLDGASPTQQLRSKTRVIVRESDSPVSLDTFPDWSFDGSSTQQADGGDSDCILSPVRLVSDPTRDADSCLVVCEVYDAEGNTHASNTRANLRRALDDGAADNDVWVGFEQEYTLFKNDNPLGWPEGGYPGPQGPFYCGVGSDRVFGREVVETHAQRCVDAGLMIYGINAEVMPGQWEFQIGYRGVSGESADPLTVCDHLTVARWLLHRTCEEFGVVASFDNKPVKGDWNGAGNHTNFSTSAMRAPGGLAAIRSAIQRLESNHAAHIVHYGAGLADRLTGLHETCSIDQFKSGVANRGASIRIPRQVEARGRGYFEDRRPGANCDPYMVCAMLIDTVCNANLQTQRAAS